MKYSKLGLLVLVGAICVIVFLSFAAMPRDEGVPLLKHELQNLETALDQYRADFGTYPEGDSSMIAHALLGRNDTHTKYLEWKSGADGFVLDPWGRPYLFDYSEDGKPLIRS